MATSLQFHLNAIFAVHMPSTSMHFIDETNLLKFLDDSKGYCEQDHTL